MGSKVVYVAGCLLFAVACTRPGTDSPIPDVRASIDEVAASIELVAELKHQEFNNNVVPSSIKTKQELGETILSFTTTDGSTWTTNLKFLVRVPGTTKAIVTQKQ